MPDPGLAPSADAAPVLPPQLLLPATDESAVQDFSPISSQSSPLHVTGAQQGAGGAGAQQGGASAAASMTRTSFGDNGDDGGGLVLDDVSEDEF